MSTFFLFTAVLSSSELCGTGKVNGRYAATITTSTANSVTIGEESPVQTQHTQCSDENNDVTRRSSWYLPMTLIAGACHVRASRSGRLRSWRATTNVRRFIL